MAAVKDRRSLGNVTRDELRHLEHRDLGFAAEHGLQLVVSVDLSADLCVLQLVLLDVSPELLGELRAGQRGRADDSSESRIGRDRFHERSIRFTSSFFGHNEFGFGVLSLGNKALLEGMSGVCIGKSSTF